MSLVPYIIYSDTNTFLLDMSIITTKLNFPQNYSIYIHIYLYYCKKTDFHIYKYFPLFGL